MTHVRLTSSKTVWYSIFILLVIEWEQWIIALTAEGFKAT